VASLRSSRKQDGEGIVELAGELTDDSSTENLEDWLEEHFVDDGVRTIRVDLSEVTLVDLEGVAALGLLAAEAVKQDKVFLIEGAIGQVRRKLEETGLLQYLHSKESET
jgi:anti-anti-sigma factor